MADVQFFGVKIVLRDAAAPVTENTAIGLYNVAGGNSEFRWLQNSAGAQIRDGLWGTYADWKEGILAENGIGPFSKSADITRGGNTANPGAAKITIRNYLPDGNIFSTYCAANGIYLNGCIMTIHLITNNVSDQKWYGICEFPKYDNLIYEIPGRGNLNKRVSNISKIISATNRTDAAGDVIGKAIPVTFGKNYGTNLDVKAIQTGNRVTTLNIMQNLPGTTIGGGYSVVSENIGDDGIESFPLKYTASAGDNVLNIVLGISVKWYLNNILVTGAVIDLNTWLADGTHYIFVTDGTCAGSYRKIITAAAYTYLNLIQIGFSPTLSGDAPGNSDFNITDQSWVSIVQIVADYEADTWPLAGYLDSAGAIVDTRDAAFTILKDKILFPVPNTLIKPDIATIEKFSLNPDSYDGSPFDINSFTFVPCKNSRRPHLNNLHPYLTDGAFLYRDGDFFKSSVDAFFGILGNPDGTLIGNRLDSTNGNYGGHVYFSPHAAASFAYALCVEIDPPALPDSLPFDALFFAIHAKIKETIIHGSEISGSKVHLTRLKWRNKLGMGLDELNNILSESNTLDPDAVYGVLDVFPNDYYKPIGTVSPDSHFYSTQQAATYQYGYLIYPMTGIDTGGKYKKIAAIGLIQYCEHGVASVYAYQWDIDFILYQAALVIQRKLSISNEIYTQLAGRIYDSSWAYRAGHSPVKAAVDCIESPVDILELIIRLQNWSENTTPPAGGWGSDYSGGVLINISSDTMGNFDYTGGELATVKGFKAAAQILDYEECYTDKLKKSLCRNFFLLNYQDRYGAECVSRIVKSSTAPADTVLLKHIVDRQDIKVEEPNPMDIFPEIFVRYNKNNATGEYQSCIRVTNVDQTAYDAAYVEGMPGLPGSSITAENLWDMCKTLWNKSGNTEKPSSDITDLTWANGAGADEIALEYLQQLIFRMSNPGITFKVHLATVLGWSVWPEEGFKFNINLPFHTGSVVIECVLTDIEVDPNSPHYVSISAIMYGSAADIPEDFNIIETLHTIASSDTWIESLATQSSPNTILEVN